MVSVVMCEVTNWPWPLPVISASIPHGLRCEFVRVWSDSHTTQTSMIMRKGSGMEKLFRTATMDIVEGAFYKKDFVGGVMLEPKYSDLK